MVVVNRNTTGALKTDWGKAPLITDPPPTSSTTGKVAEKKLKSRLAKSFQISAIIFFGMRNFCKKAHTLLLRQITTTVQFFGNQMM